MSSPPVSLSLRGVRYTLGSARTSGGLREILRGLDLSARAGEDTVLLGPNGAGKTTALRIAQGLLRPSQGQVTLLDQNPFRAGADLRARVGVMLQDGGLPQSVPPHVLLKHVSRLHRDPWPLEDLIERLDMADFLHTSIRRLSGGQRQRVALAASLIGQPEIVFLDEPSAGLDPQSRQTVFDLIAHLRRQGTGIILTTHLLEEAQRLADVVYIMRAGVVVRSGSVGELLGTQETGKNDVPRRHMLFASPRTLTRADTESAPLSIALERGHHNVPGATWRVSGVDTPAELRALAARWEDIALMPAEISFESKTLEDVFWEVSTS